MKPTHSGRASVLFAAILATVALPLTGFGAEPSGQNQVLELAPLAEGGLPVQFTSAADLPLHVTRKGGRVIDVLAAKQTLTVLAMDRYGLQVRGRGKNGPLSGWVGQKKAFAHLPKQLATLRAFYERELEIEKLVATTRPALGMSLSELKRILGKPTTHMVQASDEGKSESLVWIMKEKVDLNELLQSGTDDDILRMEVEVGRVEVELADGLAKAINRNVDGGAEAIPTVRPPIADPFGPAPGTKLAEK